MKPKVPDEKVPFTHEVPREFIEYAKRIVPPNAIFCDIGSRDALDGIYLYKALDAAECHIFEPNPTAIEICESNIAKYGEGYSIFFNPVGLSDREGRVDFFSVNPAKSENRNIGFSSMFTINPAYTKRRGAIVQEKQQITVTTLDSYFAKRKLPDLLWVDVEGAELLVFSGGEKVLEQVKLMHVEVSFRHMHIGKPLFWEIDEFLKKRHFSFFKFVGVSRPKAVLVIHKLLPNLPWRWNAIYYR